MFTYLLQMIARFGACLIIMKLRMPL